MAYVDVANQKIVYVSWNGIGWVSEYAADDSEGYLGTFERYMSLALDASGNPFISYYDGGTISLRMAKKVGGVWQTELVDGTGSTWTGYYNSIAVDSQGHPHISYTSYPNSLWYAHWDGSQWVKPKPDSTPGVGDNSAITVDSSNLPSICYVDESTYQLKYAHYTGSTWEIQMVSAPGPMHIGEDMDTCAIKIGPGNTPYISYYDHVTRHLLLAHRNGSSWPAETIDANGDTGLFNALAFFNGIPRLAYFHYSNYDVNYIKWGRKQEKQYQHHRPRLRQQHAGGFQVGLQRAPGCGEVHQAGGVDQRRGEHQCCGGQRLRIEEIGEGEK